MRLLRLAVEKQRWDLAAHTIVLATASVLEKGDKPHVSKNRQKAVKLEKAVGGVCQRLLLVEGLLWRNNVFFWQGLHLLYQLRCGRQPVSVAAKSKA